MSELIIDWNSLERLLQRKLSTSELEKLEAGITDILNDIESFRSAVDEKIEELQEQLNEIQSDKQRRREIDELEARIEILNTTISKIGKKITKPKSVQELMAEINKKRIARVNEERRERRKKRIRKKIQKRKAWKKKQERNIFHVGGGYSYKMSHTISDKDKLKTFNLPYFDNERELSKFLNTDLSTIKWLIYHREAAYLTHYVSYFISKRNGSKRQITAPKSKLKQLQRRLAANIFSIIPVAEEAHGFISDRSIITNAENHVNHNFVLNLDLKDFFHSISFDRVLGYLMSVGYSGRIASIMAMLCTTAPRKEIEIDGKVYYIAKGRRRLPQGAPTSPVLSNLICWQFDRRIEGLATSLGVNYSRYADDITFSGDDTSVISRILGTVRTIIEDEGFEINEKKIRILKPNMRQDVTGVTVNDKISVSRKWRRILRAEIHTISKEIKQGDYQRLEEVRRVLGKISFLHSINKARATKMKNKFIVNLKLVPKRQLEEFGIYGIVFPSKLEKSSKQQSLNSFSEAHIKSQVSVYSTGRISGISKADFQKLIEKEDMIWTDDVDLLDYLIVGSRPSEELVSQAESNGVKCVSHEEFVELIDQDKGISLDAWF